MIPIEQSQFCYEKKKKNNNTRVKYESNVVVFKNFNRLKYDEAGFLPFYQNVKKILSLKHNMTLQIRSFASFRRSNAE